MRFARYVSVLALSAISLTSAAAQVLPTRPRTTGNQSANKVDFFPQAGITFSDDAPKLSVQAFKYYLKVGHDWYLPFWILNTLPTISDQTIKSTTQALLDEFGGLLNVGAGFENKRINFGPLFDFDKTEVDRGLFIDWRAGTKVVDLPKITEAKGAATLIGQMLFSARMSLPILGADQKTDAGDFTALLSAAVNYSSAQRYKDVFPTAPKDALVYLNLSATINITERFYFSGGGTLATNEPQIKKRWFVSFSASPPHN